MEYTHTIHKDDYWHKLPYNHAGKCIVANSAVLSITLYIRYRDKLQV